MTKLRQLNYFIAFILVGALLAGSAYLQLYKGFNPCALCLLQRYTLALLGMVFLIGIIVKHSFIGQITVKILSISISLTGIALSGRQVWLQHYPASASGNCDVSLEYMIKALPLNEVIKKVFSGGAECTQVGWEVMNISLAQWSLLCFVLFFLFSLWQLKRN